MAKEKVITTEEQANNKVFELKKPVYNNGEEISEIHFDFEKLTGKDALDIDSELQAQGKAAIVPAASSEFLVRMAIRAAEEPIDIDFMQRLSIADFNKIVSMTRFFLLDSAN